MPSSPNSFPDPCQKYPVSLPDGSTHQGTVFLSAAVDHPRMEVGIYTYASAHAAPEDWAARLAPYLYEFSPERLVIGKFCQIADGVQFITASANHRYDGRSQLIDATHGLKRSAGVSYPNVIRGRSLSCLATALSFA
jgi:virginiamycin A acetyltransferase